MGYERPIEKKVDEPDEPWYLRIPGAPRMPVIPTPTEYQAPPALIRRRNSYREPVYSNVWFSPFRRPENDRDNY